MARISSACLALAGLQIGLSGVAHAQTVSDVIVTAQRREERLQTVPIAVNVVSAKQMETTGVVGTDDLGRVVPGLVSSRALFNGTIFMRGLGTQNAGQGDENSVALYVDGVYIFSPSSSIFHFNNIERIEVLRGPQGTLFGRNATGGLIQVVTKNPTSTPSLRVGVGYDNFDTVTGDLYGSTGLTDQLAADLSLHYSHQGEGYGVNVFNGRDVNRTREFAARTKWVYEPTVETTATVALDYTRLNSDRGVTRSAFRDVFLPTGVTAQPEFQDVNVDLQPSRITKQYGGSLHLKHSMAAADFVSISAYRRDRTSWVFDNDARPVFGAHVFADSVTKSFSQELQLLSNSAGPFQWIAGAYYLDASAANLRFASTTPTVFVNRVATQKLKSYSAFAQASYKLPTNTTLTLGTRYTKDKRSLAGSTLSAAGAVVGAPVDTSTSWSAMSWRASVDHQFTEKIMGYVSYNRGFKGGVYNQVNLAQPPVAPTKISAYEVGLKTDLVGGRLRFNTDFFYYKVKGLQLQANTIATPPATLLVNAAGAEAYGVEAEVDAVLTEQLSLTANIALLHAEYSDFPNAPANVPNATPLPGGNRATTVSATGNRMMRTPKIAYNVTAHYEVPVGSGTLTAAGSWAHNGAMYWEPDNRLREPAYDLLNASLTWAPNETWSVRLWGKNLTNTEYFTYALSSASSGDTGAVGDPRTYGVTLQARF